MELKLFRVSHQRLKFASSITVHRSPSKHTLCLCIPAVIDDDDQFLPGALDWLTLLKMAKKHSGYYSYAIVNV